MMTIDEVRSAVNNVVSNIYNACREHLSPFDSLCVVLGALFDARFNMPFGDTMKGSEECEIQDIKNEYLKLLSLNHDDFSAVFPEIVDEEILKYGNHVGIIQSKSLSELVVTLINNKNIKSIYNPFAGLGSYGIGVKGIYRGQELNEQVRMLALLSLKAHGNSNAIIDQADPIMNWDEKDAECVVSTPPIGIKINREDASDYLGMTYDEYTISKFLNSSSTYGLFVVPRSFCFRNSGTAFCLRKDVCNHNYLEMVINLPSGIFANTGVSASLIVLNKSRVNNGSSLFVDAENMYSLRTRREKVLDNNAILSAISSNDSNLLYYVDINDLYKNDCSFDISRYANHNLVVKDGQQLISLSSILTQSIGERFDFRGEKVHDVIDSKNFVENIAYLGNVNNEVFVDQTKYKFTGPHFVINMQGKVYLHKGDSSFYIGSALKNLVFKVNEEIVDPEYLAYVLITNNILQKTYFGSGMARNNPRQFLNYQIVIESDIIIQRQIVSNVKRRFFESEKKRLGIREVGSDLSHMLRMPKNKIGNKINRLLSSSSLSDQDRLHVKAIEDNFNYMLRVINSVGLDFSSIALNTHDVALADMLKNYASSLKNMEFSNIYNFKEDIRIPDDLIISCDEDLVQVLLDTAFLNVYKHAFNDKGADDNVVLLGCRSVEYESKPYACITISNNGNPLNISLEDYITKGVVGGDTGNTGKGGYHIYSIAKKHEGFVCLSSSIEWPFILEVLLPINYNNDSNLEVYEGRCL